MQSGFKTNKQTNKYNLTVSPAQVLSPKDIICSGTMVALSLCASGIIWCVATDDWNNVLSIFLNNLRLISNTCSGKYKFWPLQFLKIKLCHAFLLLSVRIIYETER